MTRAVVGGINPLDNEFYPLAVNSQGIAQIDTSGLPEPYQPEQGNFVPAYLSSDTGEDFGVVEYNGNRYGWWYRIYNMVFYSGYIVTNNVVITDARGDLRIRLDVPYKTLSVFSRGGSCIVNHATKFNTPNTTFYSYITGSDDNISLFKIDPDVPGEYTTLKVADLMEESRPGRNQLSFSGSFTVVPSGFRDQLLQTANTAETEADTQ